MCACMWCSVCQLSHCFCASEVTPTVLRTSDDVRALLCYRAAHGAKSGNEAVSSLRQPYRIFFTNDFLVLLSFEEKKAIMAAWQSQMTPATLRRSPCVSCSHNIPVGELVLVDVKKVPLHLLRNDCLPEHTFLCTYAFELYDHTILYPKGLEDPSCGVKRAWICAALAIQL